MFVRLASGWSMIEATENWSPEDGSSYRLGLEDTVGDGKEDRVQEKKEKMEMETEMEDESRVPGR